MSYYQYTDYDASAGHPFDLGLYHHWVGGVQETDAEVSVAPIFSGYYEYAELWSFGVPVPDDVWRQFTNLGDGLTVKLRKDWLVANDEIGNGVLFTNPLTTNDLDIDSMIDIRVPITITDLVKSLTSDPWSTDWIDFVRTELNLDKPPGADGNRPSAWFGSNNAVAGGNAWLIDASGGSVSRKLSTRRKWRCERINSHLWTGLPGADQQEVTYLWLIATRANLPIEVTLDDPAWWIYTNGWAPAGSYSYGRIDTYEGVDCSGECDHFASRFFEEKFGVDFPAAWWNDLISGSITTLPDEVIWHEGSAGLAVGDMPLLVLPGGAHVGIVHSLANGIDYAYSNTAGDNLGYFGNISSQGWGIAGYYRYQTGCQYEDITDYRQIWNVKLTCTGATEDIAIQLRMRYRELDASAPWYTSANHNFGGEGEARAVFGGQKERLFDGTLSAATGICTFDMLPDVGVLAPNMELVEEIAFIFPAGDAQTLTFVGFETIPYLYGSYVEGTGNVMDRIALKHSTDYFGARSYVDGCPNYRPTYGYTMDTERAEVGFKHTQDLQHPPDFEGEASDMRSLKSLSGMYNEMAQAELIYTPTWYQVNMDRDLKDVDDVVLAIPLWGDYDEDGFCLHVGKVIGDTFPVAIHYADFILQGGARGVVKAGGVRSPLVTGAVGLYYSDDGGTNKVLIRVADTDRTGAFNVGTGREKSPRTYYLYINETWIDLSSFVNVEEVWKNGGLPAVIDLFTVLDKFGYIYRFYVQNDRTIKVKTRPKNGSVQSTETITEMDVDMRAVSAEELQGLLRVYAEQEIGLINVFESGASELREFTEVF
jgi:hypothetical protein